MASFIEELVSRDDQNDPEAVPYLFGRGRRRQLVQATSGEDAWRALEIAINDDTDRWRIITIDGQRV